MEDLTLEDIKKIEPPFIVKFVTASGPTFYVSNNEFKWDKEGSVYVNPELELLMTPNFSDRPKENNIFKDFSIADILDFTNSSSKKDPWEKIAINKRIYELEVYNEPEHFRGLIEHIFI